MNSSNLQKESTLLSEGQQPYTPTRVQWLAVILNSTNIISNPVPHKGLSVVYVSDPKRDTIKIILQHPKNLSREKVDKLIEKQKSLVIKTSESYGWNSWLKIEVEIAE